MTSTPTRPLSTPEPASQRFPVAGPASRSVTPKRRAFSAAGPAAAPAELPDPSGLTFGSPEEVDAHLSALEAARQNQLDGLPTFDRDTVTAAYRATVETILADVRAARARLAEGRYGICTRCDDAIPTQRLKRRPWVSMCTPCAARQSS